MIRTSSLIRGGKIVMENNFVEDSIRELARAEIFRITRIVDGYTRDEMARITDMSESTITKIENRIIQITPKAQKNI